MMDTARHIQAVQVCRRKVAGLGDDEAWRDFLQAAVGKRSLKEMTGRELGKVLDALHDRGAPRAAPSRARSGRLADGDQDRKIRALWLALWEAGMADDPGEPALLAFVQSRAGVARLEWAKPLQKRVLIEQLKQWLARAADDPVCAVRLSVRGDDGRSDPVRLCEALWEALATAGAFAAGIHAAPDTWLCRHGYGVSAFCHLSPESARTVAGELSSLLRRAARPGGDRRLR